jgi:transcriptional regulator with XRE-family HTH domain
MSTDPINRLPGVFGKLLTRLRVEQNLTQEAFAVAAGLPDSAAVTRMERGGREPTLTEFFRIASALRSSPAILFVDVIAESRVDPTDYLHHKSRASDFVRAYRLGYYHYPGDFREQPQAYASIGDAAGAARRLNVTRHRRKLPPLDTVLIYVRIGSVSFRPDAEEEMP